MTPIYERTIIGTWLIIFFSVMAAIMIGLAWRAEGPGVMPWIPSLVFPAMLLFMGIMRITVTQTELRVRFWPGIVRKTVKLTDIDAYQVTRSRAETGFGIALKPSQNRYVISGPSAVSVLLSNGRTVMVGTPEPEKLVKALDKARKKAGLEV